MESRIKSKQRVADHGEVLTGKREDLYAKYSLPASEIAFIEKIVRPMPADGDKADRDANDE